MLFYDVSDKINNMKKLSLIALLLLAVFSSSCKKGSNTDESKIDKSLIEGGWKTSDNTYFEVYYADGKGKEWTTTDDITEDEASWFTWEFSDAIENGFTKYYTMEIGGVVPQSCKIIELTSTTFKYNNEGLRATYNLIRAE